MEEIKKYKQNRKLVTFICDNCGEEATKPESEYKRNLKLGRHNFCSRSCASQYAGHQRKGRPASEKMLKHLEDIKGMNRDEYSPFRYSYRCAKRRFKEFNLELEDLKSVWDAQQGICPYTGIKLILPEDNNISTIDITKRASLDRIDSSKGYVKDNIQFISTPINYMKNTMSDLDTKKLLKEISQFTSNLEE